MARTPAKSDSAAKPARRAAAKAPTTKAAPKRKSAAAQAAAPAPAAKSTAIRDQLTATKDTIRNEAQRKAGEIGDEMGRLYGQATARARDAANQGKNKAAEGLEGLAKMIDDSANAVDDKLGSQYGDYARSAAQTVANLAGTLEQKDVDELVDATREFVRKSPAVAIGSAAVVGFMLARLLSGRRDS